MIKTFCVDCAASVPEAGTNYTLIGDGWRLRKRETPGGLIIEWRCKACWRAFKETGTPQRTGEIGPESISRMRVAFATGTAEGAAKPADDGQRPDPGAQRRPAGRPRGDP